MAFDNTKNDVEINGLGYRITGYQKSEQAPFIPRLGAGDQQESEFNLLRAKTIPDFAAGIMQRNMIEDNQIFSNQGCYPIYDDGVLYPTTDYVTTSTAYGTGRPAFSAFCKTKDYIFWSWYATTGAATQGIYRMDTAGTIVSMGLDANLANYTYKITDMVVWRNQLWICASSISNGGMYYIPLASTATTTITAGTGYFSRMCVWKDQLYGTNAGSGVGYYFYRYTGDTVTRSFVQLAATPMQTNSGFHRLFVFNNRVYLSRNDGLYAFDGVNLVTIEDLTQQVDENNFRFPCILKGYLYYFMPDGLYRFNGAMIEKLYDINELSFPKDMRVGKNRLWIGYTNSASSKSSRFDIASGFNYTGTLSYSSSVVCFNGKGLYLYARSYTQTKSASPLYSNEGEMDSIFWFNEKLYTFTFAHPTNQTHYYTTDEANRTNSSTIFLITSIFDGGFSMVDKSMHNLELTLDGSKVTVNQSLQIEYRTSGFDGSGGWTFFGSFETLDRLQSDYWNGNGAFNGLSFKRIQFRIYNALLFSVGIAKLTLRYVITPDFKWQWQFTALCYGDDSLEPLQLADGTESSEWVSTLRGNIYDSRYSDTPVVFVDIDRLDLAVALTNTDTTVQLLDNDLLRNPTGFIKIDDEIMYYTAKLAGNNITVVRGRLLTAAAAHLVTAPVFACYRVYITPIQNERVILRDNGETGVRGHDHPTEITLTLKEV